MREVFTETYIHMSLLLYLEMVCQNVAELWNVWNGVLGQGDPFIASRCLAFFVSCCMAAVTTKGGTVWAFPLVYK